MTELDVAVPLLHDYLLASARRDRDKIALVCSERRVSYGELTRDAQRLACALAARGVARGDRVIVFGDNSVASAVAFWGVLLANAVVVMVHPQTKPDKLAYMIADCEPAAIVVDAQVWPTVVEAARDIVLPRAIVVHGAVVPGAVAWDALPAGVAPPRLAIDIDLAAIIYTSGSTGEPKGVMHTHRSMRAAASAIMAYLGNTRDDVILNVLPLSFDYGLYQMIMAFAAGARLVLERSFAYPAQVLQCMVRERVTGLPGVPTLFAMLAGMTTRADYDLSAIRYVTNTAAALPVKHIELLLELFPRAQIFSMYGLTECKRVSYLPPEQLRTRPTSVGIAIPNTELWVVDERDRRVAPGQVGQLVVRGATVMRGYWGKPEETRARLRPGPLPGEQVLYTGDYARIDEEGYLYFVGRMDDIIKSRGEKIAPREVENALVAAPGVLEAAVIGVDDELLGQAIAAFVVVEDGTRITARSLQLHCQRRLESHMVPKHIVFASSLPRTANGKIDKTKLALTE
jgi:amino acid adenylation domain-containing protein